MMASRTITMLFPPEQVGKPLVSRAVKAFDIEINILQACISPSETGRMLAVLEGTEDQIGQVVDFLAGGGIEVGSPESALIHDLESCVHCGACAGLCPVGAFRSDPPGWLVTFEPGLCIGCGICIQACSYGAVRRGGAFVAPEAGL
jgi:NAD-dependent dihydropyrimidine dehydrogenase PreA subunit